uniref:PID domain-containing protein n=1 Tax=Arion vulgaris TaxID=1028688 RepID=A0A0B7BAW9_9EUPU
MSARIKKATDPTRFEGTGISFKGKLIGFEYVTEARGDQMCQETIVKLKNLARISGGHKKKILINVSLEGLKIVDAISLIVLHTHAVNLISFISRDPTDSRAFGYIFEAEDGLHKFFAIKTATAAEQLVLALKDLFQVVFEIKKKEGDAPKEKDDQNTSGNNESQQTLEDGSTTGDGQNLSQTTSSETDNTNQVETDSSATSPQVQTEPVTNLFDLEDMAESILKGIEQVNSLELEFLTNDTPFSTSSTPTSPLVTVTPPVTTASTTSDPWGLSTVETTTKPAATSSALGDLAGLQTGPFSTSFPVTGGFGGSSGFSTTSKDPFGSDPFNSFANQPVAGSPRPSTPGFGVTNPFGSEFNQPYGIQGIPPRMSGAGVYGMMPGMVPHGVISQPVMGTANNPFAAQPVVGRQVGNPFGDDTLTFTQTAKREAGPDSDSTVSDVFKTVPKSPHDDLFRDLLDIKKSSPTRAMSPKDMFVPTTTVEKKSMNAIIASGASPRASPVPAMFLKPGISPRASPLPDIPMRPGISPRASPVPDIPMRPGISPLTSPIPSTPTILAQSSPFDDFFGTPAEAQSSNQSLLD